MRHGGHQVQVFGHWHISTASAVPPCSCCRVPFFIDDQLRSRPSTACPTGAFGERCSWMPENPGVRMGQSLFTGRGGMADILTDEQSPIMLASFLPDCSVPSHVSLLISIHPNSSSSWRKEASATHSLQPPDITPLDLSIKLYQPQRHKPAFRPSSP